MLRNCGDVRLKATTVRANSPRSPITSRPNTRPKRSVNVNMTMPPRPARQERAAEHRRGKHVEFATDESVRNDLLGEIDLHEAADARHQPQPTIGNELDLHR